MATQHSIASSRVSQPSQDAYPAGDRRRFLDEAIGTERLALILGLHEDEKKPRRLLVKVGRFAAV